MSFYPTNIQRCTHIKTNGTQCGSPALRRGRFCFFHKRWREQRVRLNRKASANSHPSINLPVLEDPESVQVALLQVLRLILAGHIDPKIAGLILYGLQTASLNLKDTRFEPGIVTAVVIDPTSVDETPLGAQAWEPEDFEDDEEEEDEEEEQEDEEQDDEEQEDEDDEEDDDDDNSGGGGYQLQKKGDSSTPAGISAQDLRDPIKPNLPEIREQISHTVREGFRDIGVELRPKPPQPSTATGAPKTQVTAEGRGSFSGAWDDPWED